MGSIYTLIWQISSKVFSILYLPFGFVKKKKKSPQQSQNSFPPVLQIAFQVKELVLMLIKTDKRIDVLYKTTLYVNLFPKTAFFPPFLAWFKKMLLQIFTAFTSVR